MQSNSLPIIYKLHPKMQQILQEKQRRRQILQQQRQKQQIQQEKTRLQRKQYFEGNKVVIGQKRQAIYSKKLNQRNKIREEQKQRQIRIEIKKSQRLQKYLPLRYQMIQQLKQSYIKFLEQKDHSKQIKIKQVMEQRLEEANKQLVNYIPLQVRIKEENIIDINEGKCVLCLSQDAEIFMVQCRHLISCQDCVFMLRMQKKCPVCRKVGDYKNLNKKEKKRKN